MTAHWIEVTDGEWKLRAEVVGFQPISGEHSGVNLGKYFVGLCDRVGITSEKHSKVRRKRLCSKKLLINSYLAASECNT
jgi:hypothetical protein